MFAYIFAGLAGGLAYLYHSVISWLDTLWLVLGAVPVGDPLL
jgi:hypothetical protein